MLRSTQGGSLTWLRVRVKRPSLSRPRWRLERRRRPVPAGVVRLEPEKLQAALEMLAVVDVAEVVVGERMALLGHRHESGQSWRF